MRVAVTGATGRLGRALVAAIAASPGSGPSAAVAWSRPDFDLDRPADAAELVRRDRPDVVVHAAAWTDVDGCARDPELAMRRNARATSDLARVCAAEGVDLVFVSTNEVFDGSRTDGRGYSPADRTNPINAYGASKLAGEEGAAAAYADVGGPDARLAIVRTAWLYGPPGADFPTKIRAAAERARKAGEPLQLVTDEVGSPTLTGDLAAAIVGFISGRPRSGTFHVVNGGRASRSEWAREVLRLASIDVELREIPSAEWPRPSRPPLWAVLEHSADFGPPLRDWRAALATYTATSATAGAGTA